MTNRLDTLPVIPAKRYFTLDELCRLADISADQFAAWQHEHGIVIGRGGLRYTRLDVIKVRQLRSSFAPYMDAFTRNRPAQDGRAAITADEARAQLQKVLHNIETVLAK